jgi:hypothetical protein
MPLVVGWQHATHGGVEMNVELWIELLLVVVRIFAAGQIA